MNTTAPRFVREWRLKKLITQAQLRNLFPYNAKREKVRKLLMEFPYACRIRYEGKCHCGKFGLFSFQLPDDLPGGEWHKERADGMETCGYFCGTCGFSNAGRRTVKAVKV